MGCYPLVADDSPGLGGLLYGEGEEEEESRKEYVVESCEPVTSMCPSGCQHTEDTYPSCASSTPPTDRSSLHNILLRMQNAYHASKHLVRSGT